MYCLILLICMICKLYCMMCVHVFLLDNIPLQPLVLVCTSGSIQVDMVNGSLRVNALPLLSLPVMDTLPNSLLQPPHSNTSCTGSIITLELYWSSVHEMHCLEGYMIVML